MRWWCESAKRSGLREHGQRVGDERAGSRAIDATTGPHRRHEECRSSPRMPGCLRFSRSMASSVHPFRRGLAGRIGSARATNLESIFGSDRTRPVCARNQRIEVLDVLILCKHLALQAAKLFEDYRHIDVAGERLARSDHRS